jgi:L-idonate 5-dehydrogenase
VRRLRAGERIADQPQPALRLCRYCQQGLQNHCLDMRYYGSAMRTPHVQGAFRQEIVVIETWQAHKLADRVSDRRRDGRAAVGGAACRARRAGPLLGKQGAGHRLRADRRAAGHRRAARRRGAHRGDRRRRPPAAQGAEGRRRRALNVAEDPDGLQRFSADKGTSTCCSRPAATSALRGAFDALRPRGVIVQVGLGGEMTLPINTIVAKEFDLRGAFRFHEEFAWRWSS